jgi:hypothetical protein
MRSAISSKNMWQSERMSICVTTLGCMEEDTEVWGDGRKLLGRSLSQQLCRKAYHILASFGMS